jgi:2'-5' RNA ligase
LSGERARLSGERARLFVALELPEAALSELIRWRSGVLRELPGIRPVSGEALHVTLCFLGWRWESEIEPIARACEAVAIEPPAHLGIGAPIWLPVRRPRVLAVALEDQGGGLTRLHSLLSDALSAGGWYAQDARPFLGHVTVGRAHRDARVRAVDLPAPTALEFEASQVRLYRSHLGGGAASYESLHRVELGSVVGPLNPVSVVERFHQLQARAYAEGEMDALRELLSEDVVWHVPGRSAIAGDHRGIKEVLAYFERRRAMTDATFRVTVHGVTTIGDRVVQLAGGSAMRDGRALSWETAGVFRVAGGRIVECWLLPFDPDAFDEAWG